MRSNATVLDAFMEDLASKSLNRFAEIFALAKAPMTFRVKAGKGLRRLLRSAAGNRPLEVRLVSQSQSLASLVQSRLPADEVSFKVCSNVSDLAGLRSGVLALLDRTESVTGEEVEAVPGLDHLLVRYLVPPQSMKSIPPAHLLEAIALDPGNPLMSDGLGPRLGEALAATRFTRAFSAMQASRRRWKLGIELSASCRQGIVYAILKPAGSERIASSQDLRGTIPFAEVPTCTLNDVLGQDTLKARFMEHVHWLQDPDGAPGLRGFVLSGPPGTGKSFLGAAIAGSAECPVAIVGSSELQKMWYGQTEAAIRDLFDNLQGFDAAVLVLDEFEALAWRRDRMQGSLESTQAAVVGQLLTSMDATRSGKSRVVVVATTNHFDRLDPAVVRSLRLGEHIVIGPPDLTGRRALLRGFLGGEARGMNLEEAAALTAGMTPADLSHLVEAARKLSAKHKLPVSLEHLREAHLEACQGGTAPRMDMPFRSQLAYHEAGHAVLAYHLFGADRVEHISLLPGATGSLAAAYLRPVEGPELMDRSWVARRLAVNLGGRAAERLVFGDEAISAGAAQDLAHASSLAEQAIGQWGLDPDSIPLSTLGLSPALQDRLGTLLLERITAWIREAEAQALSKIREHRGDLDRLAAALQAKEILHQPEILALLSGTGPTA